MSLLTAPFYALFSVEFYKRIIRTPLTQGFLYLIYLSIIACVGLACLLSFRIVPSAEGILEWAKQEMPPLVWTPEGLEMPGQSSEYTMYYPDYGPAIIFNMEKQTVTAQDIGKTFAYVTKKNIFYRGRGQILSYEITAPVDAREQMVSSITIGPEFLDQLFERAKGMAYGLGLFMAFIVFYFSKLLAALCFSLIAYLMNQSREFKLSYSVILNLTIFALTAETLIDALRMVVPQLMLIPFGFFGSMIVTIPYLFIAVRKTEEKLESL